MDKPLKPTSQTTSQAATQTALDAPEVVEVERETVSCDGGGALGHPRVWLNMEGRGQIDCPYCDRRFVLKPGAAGHGGH